MELKPCPFCGAEAEMRYHPSCMRDPSHRSWEAGCSICDARVGNTIYAIGKTRDEVITDWNTRAERTCRDTGRYCFTCSECGWIANEPHHMLGGFWPEYCPNCGAKVVE